ncbi:MAG TPA: CusA/CzcA family heavy metal efflux RND transporter [Gemmatimonadales bacterium]|jgi:Cu(I)/Ag(I) efflux system membrane protein CusA/SilA|nr:CusA/CzcA family heavy metal efflux RND transporter [Gemmatimonadales bacterium]
MLRKLIAWSVANRFIVLLATLGASAAGVIAIRRTPLEALPDLSDVQVIVQAEFNEQAPRIVEDQVTYPIAAEMLKVPGARTVRGYSFFGISFVYVIFEDGTDLYWARSRVLEYLNGIRAKLPPSVTPTLGPDATGLGWVFQYALEDTTGQRTLAELRSIQDWYLRYALTAVPGVSEVAAIGGFEKQYQVDLDPAKLLAYDIPITRVMAAIQNANSDVGAMVVELSEREYMVRGLGYLKSISDIENVVVGATPNATPIRVAELGRVTIGPAVRRGIAELDGRGDAVGGIVIMRFGENALTTIQNVKRKLAEIQGALPAGVVVRPVYDRSDLIERAIATLRGTLIEESLIVAMVCLVFLLHARSALVAILTLPIGILMAFIAMRALGVGADIMSLGGIAIAIGAMIDAAIVMIENMHKRIERAVGARQPTTGPGRGGGLDTTILTPRERWQIVVEASQDVGPALFFSLLIITVSFLPVFSLEGQEGRLFKPLAYTKSFAMAAASLLSVTLVPVTMGLFIRGTLYRERANPVNRALIALYRPVLHLVLRHRRAVIWAGLASLVLTWIPWKRLGSEFMPPLGEGTILYMPTTLPGVSVARAREILRTQDAILKQFPEVEHVWGKAGRANTATDPAGLDMFETTISLKPEREWRPGMTYERLVAAMDSAVRLPGVTNAWTMPIKGRIDMLATGIRTPVGIKIFGPELAELERLGKAIERAVQTVPGTRSAFAERAESGYYLDIAIDRAAAARHGLNVGDVQAVIATAVGGMTITQTVEGRERYGVRVRYPQELRDTPERLASVLVPVAHGPGPAMPTGTAMAMAGGAPLRVGAREQYVPLGQVAAIQQVPGPMVVRTEDAVPTAWVYVDVAGRDIGSYVAEAQRVVAERVPLPPGYRIVWSGQYEYMQRAAAQLKLVVPATLAIIFLLLYLNFKSVAETLIVMLSLPFALVGGIWFLWLLGYNWSVAVAVGFIALAGVAAETGVVMLLYLDHAWAARRDAGRVSLSDLSQAVLEGAGERVRPLMMTVTAIIAGLLPVLWGSGAGASVMRRIAAPMIGGMVSSTVLTLVVIPAVYSLWKEWELRRAAREAVETALAPARVQP